MINKVILVGRAGGDAERQPVGSTVKAKFTMATSKSWIDKATGERKEKTQWHNVSSFMSVDYIVDTIKKGSQVFVEGEIEYNQYQNKKGETVYFTNIEATRVQNLVPKEKAAAPREVVAKPTPKIDPIWNDVPEEEAGDVPF